jgi:hypothetical protein
MNSPTSKRIWLYLVISLLAAAPAGGFLFGLTHAGDPDPNPIGRVAHAFLMAVETPLHAGFPPRPLGEPGQTANVWPYIVVAAFLVFGGCVYRGGKSARKRNESSARG